MSTNEARFRAHKRKKILKRRPEEEVEVQFETQQPSQSTIVTPLNEGDRVEDSQNDLGMDTATTSENRELLPISEIIRRRRNMQSRRGGIEFSNSSQKHRRGTDIPDEGTVAALDKPNVLEMAAKRFAPQTGLVTETTDQHMTAFIDSEMAKIRAGYSRQDEDEYDHTESTSRLSGERAKLPQRLPAALGQIQEIDLGPDAALRNVARTEAAARRIQGGQPAADDAPPERVRLGRDGKPRRRRNRRGSDDIKRDQIVEAVLKESKLDLYDESEDAKAVNDNDQAADDIIAEQFRRDFMDAVQSRNHSRRSANAQAAKKGAKVEEKPRGPKLGGSRSARAAMHAQEKMAKKR